MNYAKDKPLFTIAIAAQLSGLHPRTLMLYEKAGLISPHRTETKRRRYSQDNLHQIKIIHYLAQTHNINLAGIKLLFSLLSWLQKDKELVEKKLFQDFRE